MISVEFINLQLCLFKSRIGKYKVKFQKCSIPRHIFRDDTLSGANRNYYPITVLELNTQHEKNVKYKQFTIMAK